MNGNINQDHSKYARKKEKDKHPHEDCEYHSESETTDHTPSGQAGVTMTLVMRCQIEREKECRKEDLVIYDLEPVPKRKRILRRILPLPLLPPRPRLPLLPVAAVILKIVDDDE